MAFREGIDADADHFNLGWDQRQNHGRGSIAENKPLFLFRRNRIFRLWSRHALEVGLRKAWLHCSFEKCAYLYYDGRLATDRCDYEGWALCTVACEDASSGSELSRANLPVFALFAAASIFKAFYALVGF